MPLHIDYRPEQLEEFYGNLPTVRSLKAILDREKDISHVFLFQGPSGCGKTTLSRIVADKLGCDKEDLQEINASNNRGIETAREIIRSMVYKPLSGNVKVYLLDEIHQATKDFQNSLLKALEDTPEHVFFILCTTNPTKLLLTVRNRCSIFEVSLLPKNRIIQLITDILESEETEMSESVIAQIAEMSEGCPRQALILLDQVIDLDDDKREETVKRFLFQQKQVIDLCRAIMDQKKWKIIAEILKAIEEEPETVRRAVLGYFNSVLLNGNESAAWILECFADPFYDTGKPGLTLACYLATQKTL